MRDWLFSDMGWLIFSTWSVMVAAVSYAAFGRDLQSSEVPSSCGDSASRVAVRDVAAR